MIPYLLDLPPLDKITGKVTIKEIEDDKDKKESAPTKGKTVSKKVLNTTTELDKWHEAVTSTPNTDTNITCDTKPTATKKYEKIKYIYLSDEQMENIKKITLNFKHLYKEN